jgi:DNA-binding beta-propeller fold protein YncE
MRNRRTAAWAFPVVAAVTIALSAPCAALAFTEAGALSQLPSPNDCVGEAGPALCGTRLETGLGTTYQVVLSPDSRSAYSVALGGALIEYSRDTTTGALTVIGCVTGESGGAPCAPENVQSGVTVADDMAAIAISPDGKDAYVLDQDKAIVVEFERDTETGLLTLMRGGGGEPECVTGQASFCETFNSAKGLGTPYGIAVSPDGKSVYVASLGEEVAELERDTLSGTLKPIAGAECIGGAGTSCPVKSAIGLAEDIGVIVSSDNKNVYVAAGAKEENGDVAAFSRNTSTGALAQLAGKSGCYSEKIAACEPANAMQGSDDLAISAGGLDVYATSFKSNAIVELERDAATGVLKQVTGSNGCISTSFAGCKAVLGIEGPLGVAVSPDEANVYVDGASAEKIVGFKREGGTLIQLSEHEGCLSSGSGCEGFEGLPGLEGARRLAVSPDGTNVYVAAQEGNAIAELNRAEEPRVTNIETAEGSEAGGVPVELRGEGFVAGATVAFAAGGEALSVTVNSSQSITAVTPPGNAPVSDSVVVTTYAGESEAATGYTTTAAGAPTVTGVGPRFGAAAGGTRVEVTGSEFIGGGLGASEVFFGAEPAGSVTFNSPTSLTAVAPPGVEGPVHVFVKTAHGTSTGSAQDEYLYVFEPPDKLGGLNTTAYCEHLGFNGATTLLKGGVEGPEFAFENWACETSPGDFLGIAATGPAPSEEDMCRFEYPGVSSFAYTEEPDSAFSWDCYEALSRESPESRAKAAASTPTTPPGTKPSVPAPVAGRSGDAAPVSGRVLVKLPGAKGFVALETLTSIPFGTVIDATRGRVVVTTVGPHGSTQVGEFFEGQFVLRQGRGGVVLAELSGGDFSVCPTAAERAHRASARASARKASPKHVVRKLWADAHGSYSTKGNYAAGAVQGTEWLTEDRCDGTLIKVTRDKVKVTNLVRHKVLTVKIGHQYLAKAP